MCERQEEQIAKLKCVCEVQKKKLCYIESMNTLTKAMLNNVAPNRKIEDFE